MVLNTAQGLKSQEDAPFDCIMWPGLFTHDNSSDSISPSTFLFYFLVILTIICYLYKLRV